MKQIRIIEAFIFAFKTLKKYPMLLLAPPIFFSLIYNGIEFYLPADLLARQAFIATFYDRYIVKLPASLISILIILLLVFALIATIITISLEIGRIRIAIHAFNQDNNEPTWSIYNNFGQRIMLPYFWASLLLCIVIIGGTILLIIPGIIFALMYMFMLFVLVEKKLPITESSRVSNKLTNGIKWQLFGFVLLEFFLALIIMIPISILQISQLYFLYLPLNTIISPIIGTFFTMSLLFIYKDISVQQENLN